MDSGSQNAIAIIEALRTATDDVHKFVYQVFRKTNAKGWTQHHNVSFYGEGISGDKGLTMGCAIWRDATGNQALIFSVYANWNANNWTVYADVQDEDGDREPITDVLWESPRYKAETLEGFIESLQKSLAAICSSLDDPRVAENLATIQRR